MTRADREREGEPLARTPPKFRARPLRTSLLARTNVVLAFSAVAIAATALAALQVFVVGPMTERSADDEAGLVVLSAQTWAELPDYTDARPAFELEMARMHDLVISSDIRDLPPAAEDNDYFALLRARISERLGAPVRLLEGDELVWAELPIPGGLLQIGFAPGQQDEPLPYVGLIIGVVGAVIVLVTSSLVVRRIAQPLAETAGAVEAFRGAEGFSPLPEKGPRELVTLAESFNRMAREISTLLSSRTTLLAGISHDLRTPLARMRLAVELLPDDVDPTLVARMEGNLERMDELIGDALRFARGAGEAAQELLLKPYIESVVADVDTGVPVRWQGDDDARGLVAPSAFARVLANLVDNARRHGEDAAVVVEVDGGLVVHVVDSGPGIPEADRERVFQPFFRLDRPSAREAGGSGLGLAIVHQLCLAHGWRVGIGASATGGADVWVSVSTLIQTDTKPATGEITGKQPFGRMSVG